MRAFNLFDSFKDWLIVKLGGVSASIWKNDSEIRDKIIKDLEGTEIQLKSWKDRANSLNAEFKSVNEALRYERARREALEAQIIEISKERKSLTQDALSVLPMSWPRARRMLEEADRESVRRNSNKGGPEVA